MVALLKFVGYIIYPLKPTRIPLYIILLGLFFLVKTVDWIIALCAARQNLIVPWIESWSNNLIINNYRRWPSAYIYFQFVSYSG